jgi:hypothetical protein
MALSYVAAGAWDNSNTTVTPAMPTGWAAGDLLVLTLASKYEDASLGTDPTGWTSFGAVSIGVGRAQGNDNGGMRMRAFWRIAQTGDTGPALAPTPNNASAAHITAYRVAAGKTFGIQGVLVADDTAGSAFSLAAGSTLGLAAGDILHADLVLNGDAPTFGATSTVAATGATFGAQSTNVADAALTAGTDMRGRSSRWAVSTGPASGNLTLANTLAGTVTNAVGGGLLLRIREVDPPAPTITTLYNNASSQLVEASAVSGAVTYEWEVDGVSVQNTSSRQLVRRPLVPGQLYAYRVRAVFSGPVNGTWSTTTNLTTPVPTLPLLNTAEGGTEDAGVTGTGTTGIVTSGGTSGHAFDTFLLSTGATLTYDNERVRTGSTRSFKHDSATGANAVYIWSDSITGKPLTQLTGRVYVNFSGYASGQRMCHVRDGAAASLGGWGMLSTGMPVLRDAAAATVASGGSAIPTGQWVRFEWMFRSDGYSELRVYHDAESDAENPTEVVAGYVTAHSGVSRMDFGSYATGYPAFWSDDIGLGTNWLGPTQPRAGSNPTANAGSNQSAIDGELVTLSASGGVSYSWRQVDGPTVTLNNSTTASPTFTYDDDATYRAQPR